MNDLQIHHLAAKNTGIKLDKGTTRITGTMETWRPLEDSALAFELAIKYEFSIKIMNNNTIVELIDNTNSLVILSVTEPHNSDRNAASRRAIVLAVIQMKEAVKSHKELIK